MENFGTFWEELKMKISEELTSQELKDVLFLMKDKLGPQFPVLWESDDPTDLFRFLENNMTEVESLEILKHILGVMNYYPALSNQSLNKIIAEYEQKMKEIEVKCKLHRDAYFIGRHQEKKFIRSRLASNDKGVWIFGQGGLGKTTLVHEICFWVKFYEKVDVINVNLKGVCAVEEVARLILIANNDIAAAVDRDVLMSQALTSVERLSATGKPYIMILDSVEDWFENDRDSAGVFMKRLLDELTFDIKLLVTSRLRMYEVTSTSTFCGLSEHELLPLSKEAAFLLLRISSKPMIFTDGECSEILAYSGRSPLAIRLIARAVNYLHHEQRDITIRRMLDQLQKTAFMSQILECIQYSYARLSDDCQKDLLRLSVFDNSYFEIDEFAFMTEKSEEDSTIGLMFLRYRNLVEIHESELQTECIRLRYYLHPLVLQYLKQLEQPAHINRLYVRLFFKKIINVKNTESAYFEKQVSLFRNRSANIKKLFVGLQDDPEAFSIAKTSSLYKLSSYAGSPADRVQLLCDVAESHRFAKHHNSYLYWYIMAVTTCIDNDDVTKAEELLMNIQNETKCESANEGQLAFLHGQYYLTKGRIFHNKNRFVDSEEYLTKAQALFHLSGTDEERVVELASTWNALGNVYYKLKNYKKSLLYHQKASDILRQYIVDSSSSAQAIYMFNLGTIKVYRADILRKSQRDVADELYQGALNDFNESMDLDIKHTFDKLPPYVTKLVQRSFLFYRMNRYEEAMADAKAAVKLSGEIFTECHSVVTKAYFNLGRLLFNMFRKGPKESSRNALLEASHNLAEMAKQIKAGSMENKDCEEMLRLFQQVVRKVGDRKRIRDAEILCQDVRTGSDSSDEISSSELSSSSSSSSSTSLSSSPLSSVGTLAQRRDSGIEESIFTRDGSLHPRINSDETSNISISDRSSDPRIDSDETEHKSRTDLPQVCE